MLPLKRKTASSSVGTLPPLQVTFWITRSSPEPVADSSRFQPGEGSNESIEKPSGTVSSISVVVAPSSSVGTESVNCWSTFDLATGGLMIACAEAAPASTSVRTAAPAAARANLIGLLSFARSGSGRERRSPRTALHRDERRRERGEWCEGDEGLRREPAAPELADDGPHPGEHVLDRLGQRGRGERERGEQRDRVPVHRPDQAREAVEADPGAPVQVRLEQREGERAGEVERRPRGARAGAGAASARRARAAGARARARRPRRARRRAPSRAGSAPARRASRSRGSARRRSARARGPAGSARARRRASARSARAGPRRPATPGGALSSHPQRKGSGDDAAAVTELQEQPPGPGDRQAARRRSAVPGPAGRPTTFAPPSTLVQPGVEGPQTWVWK